MNNNLPEHRKREYKLITSNKKAFFNYEIISKLEAGIMLTGTEVKSLRTGKCSLQDAYCFFPNKETDDLFAMNIHISEYSQGNINNHDPKRKRKILMHKREQIRWRTLVNEKAYTIVPTEIYFSGHLVKIEIALVRPKKNFDKRETIKKRDTEREVRREVKNFN
jgi:SsrA-binding protein